MARPNRGFIDGGIYHILNRGNGRQPVFLSEGDYRAFIDVLQESKRKFSVALYAYSIMPNHFHFVAECSSAKTYSPWLQWLTTTHARRYHKYYGGSGHVWQGRFKSFLIGSDEYFLTVLRYVESNPLRAGLVCSADLWPWSSFRQRDGFDDNKWIDEPPLPLPQGWSDWVNRPIGEPELIALRASVNRQAPYGPKLWQIEMCKRLKMESVLKPLGRPKRGQTP